MKALIKAAVIILICAGIYSTGQWLDSARYSGDVREELMYFPSGRFFSLLAPGFPTLLCDLLWLRGIQYYGEHRRTDREYFLAEHIFSTITDADPHFISAYRFGGFVLAQDVGDPAAAIELMRKGIRNNPSRWEPFFDLGFLYFAVLRNNPLAAHYFRLASRLPDAPDIAKRFSAFAFKKAGKLDVAKAVWQELYNSSQNPVIRETASNALMNIEIDETCQALQKAVDVFYEHQGRYPSSIDELRRSGYVDSIPDDPFGGFYFFDPQTRKVLSSSRVSKDAETAVAKLKKRLEAYFSRYGRYPESLDELVKQGMLASLPQVCGADFIYDAGSASIRTVFWWERKR